MRGFTPGKQLTSKTNHMRYLFFMTAALLFLACGSGKKKGSPETGKGDTVISKADTVAGNMTDSNAVYQLPDAATVNDMMLAQGGPGWRVLSDKDTRADIWADYDKEVQEKRKTDPNYPFILKGDFNADGQTDYAALVTNDQKEYERLKTAVVFFPSGGKMILEDKHFSTEHTVIELAPKGSTITGYTSEESDKEINVKLNFDGVLINNHDAGGYWIYWDGKKFRYLYAEG